MGYYRFRLSNMMPNAWFYRLKDMSRASRSHGIPSSKKRSQPQRTSTTTTTPRPVPPPQQSYLPNRTSYYFPRREKTENPTNSPIHPKASDTHFPTDPPRKPNRRSKRGPIRQNPKLVSSSDSSGCNCGTALSSVCKSKSMPETLPYLCEDHSVDARRPAIASNTEFDRVECWSQSCNYRVTSSATDIVVDLDSRSSFNQKFRIPRSFDGVTQLDLPPIITKPVKKAAGKAQLDGITESSEQVRHSNGSNSLNEHKSPRRRIPPVTRRTKTEACQRSMTAARPKAAKKQRNGLVESFAIMKMPSDPEREFGESMVEMIVENSIRAPKDLEELLACYLSLNSDEYHEVILKVFTEIWFELANLRF